MPRRSDFAAVCRRPAKMVMTCIRKPYCGRTQVATDFPIPSAFRPWFYRLIVNHFKNRRRGAWWRHFVPLTSELEEQMPGWDPSGQHWANRQLAKAFAAVTPEERALITLHEIEGWTVAELAELYKRPEGTIKARLSRARAKMRKALAPTEDREQMMEKTDLKPQEVAVCVVTKPEKE